MIHNKVRETYLSDMNKDGDVEVSFTKLRDEKQQLNARTKEK